MSISNATITTREELEGVKCFNFTTFKGDFSNTHFMWSQFDCVEFQQCNLEGVLFDNCTLERVNFFECNLAGVWMKGCRTHRVYTPKSSDFVLGSHGVQISRIPGANNPGDPMMLPNHQVSVNWGNAPTTYTNAIEGCYTPDGGIQHPIRRIAVMAARDVILYNSK